MATHRHMDPDSWAALRRSAADGPPFESPRVDRGVISKALMRAVTASECEWRLSPSAISATSAASSATSGDADAISAASSSDGSGYLLYVSFEPSEVTRMWGPMEPPDPYSMRWPQLTLPWASAHTIHGRPPRRR